MSSSRDATIKQPARIAKQYINTSSIFGGCYQTAKKGVTIEKRSRKSESLERWIGYRKPGSPAAEVSCGLNQSQCARQPVAQCARAPVACAPPLHTPPRPADPEITPPEAQMALRSKLAQLMVTVGEA